MLPIDMEAATIALGALGLAAAGVLGWVVGTLGSRAKLADERRRSSAAAAELERSEAAELDRRATQDLILGSMQEGVLLFDASLETAFANDALERHLRSRPGSVGQLFPPDLREAVRRVATSTDIVTLDVERSAPTRWLRVTVAPAGEGAVLLVVADVTDARRIETVRRDFVANASHELKTPATSIQAAAETLRAVSGDDPEAVTRFAAQLE